MGIYRFYKRHLQGFGCPMPAGRVKERQKCWHLPRSTTDDQGAESRRVQREQGQVRGELRGTTIYLCHPADPCILLEVTRESIGKEECGSCLHTQGWPSGVACLKALQSAARVRAITALMSLLLGLPPVSGRQCFCQVS